MVRSTYFVRCSQKFTDSWQLVDQRQVLVECEGRGPGGLGEHRACEGVRIVQKLDPTRKRHLSPIQDLTLLTDYSIPSYRPYTVHCVHNKLFPCVYVV